MSNLINLNRRRILINQGATMTIETTSTSSNWSPLTILNYGNPLVWEVSGGVTIPPQTINDPTFDLSGNTGTAIITVKDISNLTRFFGSDLGITSMNVSEAYSLENFGVVNNGISVIDISNNLNLISLNLSVNSLTNLDISNNSSLLFVDSSNNPLTSTSTDNIITTLDGHGLSNGTLTIPSNRTSASDTAKYNLETVKNWTITES